MGPGTHQISTRPRAGQTAGNGRTAGSSTALHPYPVPGTPVSSTRKREFPVQETSVPCAWKLPFPYRGTTVSSQETPHIPRFRETKTSGFHAPPYNKKGCAPTGRILFISIYTVTYLQQRGFSCLKKSLPLSSTRMKAGKSSTSIFQMASMPSSGYSTHSMLLILFWARMAAGPPMEPR